MPEKTKSRLRNKSLSSAEIAKKVSQTQKTEQAKLKQPEKSGKSEKAKKPNPEAKPQEKSTSESTKPEIIKVKTSKTTKTTPKPITKNPSAQKAPKNSTKKSDTSSKTTTIRVKRVTPSNINAESSKKPKTANNESALAVTTKPKPHPNPTPKPESEPKSKPKPAATKNHPAPKPKKTAKKLSFLSIFSQVIAGILCASSVFFIAMLVYLDVLPTHYSLIIIALILIIACGCGFLLWHQKPKVIIKAPVNIVSIILSCIYLVCGGYIAETSGFLDNLKPHEYISEEYYLIVKNDSTIQDTKDLQDKAVGTFDERIELYQAAIKKLNETVPVELKSVKSIHSMTEGLLSGEFDAAFLSSVHKSIIDEDSAEFSQNTRILHTIEVKVKADSVDEPKVNVTTEPFTIYISGNDSYGDLSARGLSDVNMLATVNPVTHEILLTSIPRDCFVQLHGTTGVKDKLTHAGLYGVQMSILTIEELLNINIDYYIKINFPALVGLVDAIGGIDVYSDKRFKPLHGDRIVEQGMNHFDGKLALAFARERMAYTYGDRHRVQNQRDVLNAIIKKVSNSPVILTKTNEILNSLSSNLDTNISKSEISSLVKLQLSSMPEWRVGEYMVNGSDLYTYTYTFGDQLRYVMPPFPESIQAAHDYITGIMEGRDLDELNIPQPEKSWK